jgi:hypothetical protein
VQTFTSELVDRDLLVRVGSGSKVHVFRSHPRLEPVAERLSTGASVRAVALCGSKGTMTLVEDEELGEDDVCGTCARMLEETARRRTRPAGRAAAS